MIYRCINRRQFNVILHFFFFNDTATTEIYTLSLHDALPIYREATATYGRVDRQPRRRNSNEAALGSDRKSTRLNSSHSQISYAVFCLKKKKSLYQNSPSATQPRIFRTRQQEQSSLPRVA